MIWPKSGASWRNVKIWVLLISLTSAIALSIFYFIPVVEFHAIKKTTVILLYFKHLMKRKYFKVTNMKAILVVMNTTELVVKIRPEKIPYGIWTHDLWVQTRTGLNIFSVLIFTTSSVVFISVRIAPIFVSSTAFHIYHDFHMFAVIYTLKSLKYNWI